MTEERAIPGRLFRARFYGILDRSYVRLDRWERTGAALLTGGADLLQVRAKESTAEEREDLLLRVLPVIVEARAVPIVNDDVALAARHAGVGLHLGQDDTPVDEAREVIGADRVLGLSTHSVEQARAALEMADRLDYFCIGPVFATGTKPDYEPVGLDTVRAVVELNRSWRGAGEFGRLPLFCIGGVDRQTVGRVREAGGERVVTVSDVLMADDPAAAVREIRFALESQVS